MPAWLLLTSGSSCSSVQQSQSHAGWLGKDDAESLDTSSPVVYLEWFGAQITGKSCILVNRVSLWTLCFDMDRKSILDAACLRPVFVCFILPYAD